jgi:TP53 regulating kinase-like protein
MAALLIRRGAEADLFLDEWHGHRVIRKVRTPRPYRHPKLDAEIRAARTMREASVLVDAKRAGVPVPLVLFVNIKGAELIIQYVEGERLKELIEGHAIDVRREFARVGHMVAKLHRAGIVHGDITTSNLVRRKDGELILIDFGLAGYSVRDEDRAVDIHLLKEALLSAHPDAAEEALDAFLRAYRRSMGREWGAVHTRLKEIEMRGRYARLG